MKLKFGVTLKITLVVILASLGVIAMQVTVNFYGSQDFFGEILEQHSLSIFDALDSRIIDIPLKNNSKNLSEELDNFIKLNNKILLVGVYLFGGDETFKFELCGSAVASPIYSIYNTSSFRKINLYTFLFFRNSSKRHVLLDQIDGSIYAVSHKILYDEDNDGVIDTYGSYGMVIDFAGSYEALETRVTNQALISIIMLAVFSICVVYVMRKIFAQPLIKLKKTTQVFGKGNLDEKVDIRLRDEIGDLADAFNQMAKDLKESRDKINDYNRILENLLDQKDEFIGQLGHDLKNPMQPLIGLLPMLIEKEDDPEKKDALVVMNKNVEYMHDLIFDTLELAKLRHSNIEFDIENINLRDEAQDAIDAQKILLKESKISVDNKIDAGIMVQADRLRLSEVFKNLITNSVKYTPKEGGGKITVDATVDDKWVTVSVKDMGIGMTKDQIKRVFNEFYKADRTSSDYYSTGLGLPIARRIVEKHGGKIWVESAGPGKGSTFYFTLQLGEWLENE